VYRDVHNICNAFCIPDYLCWTSSLALTQREMVIMHSAFKWT